MSKTKKITPYRSIFGTTAKSLAESRMKPGQKAIVEKTMKRIRLAIREMEDGTDVSPSAIAQAVKDVEEIIIDAIAQDGVTSPVVDTLSQAAQELEAQRELQDEIDSLVMESRKRKPMKEQDDEDEDVEFETDEEENEDEMEEGVLRLGEEDDDEYVFGGEDEEDDEEEGEDMEEDIFSDEGESNADFDASDSMGIGSDSEVDLDAEEDNPGM